MHALCGKERCRTYASVSSPEYEFWVTDEYVVTSGWDRRTAVGVTVGRWEEIRDEYGEDIVELLVEAHGYTVGEARRNVEGDEGTSTILVIEHGEEEAGGGMGAVERTHPTSHPHLTTHIHGRSGRGGRAAGGGRGRGLGGMTEQISPKEGQLHITILTAGFTIVHDSTLLVSLSDDSHGRDTAANHGRSVDLATKCFP